MFGERRKPPLIGIISIPLGMIIPSSVLVHRLSLYSLFVGLLGAQRAWCKMTIMMTNVKPIVTKGNMFEVFALNMGVIMTRVIP